MKKFRCIATGLVVALFPANMVRAAPVHYWCPTDNGRGEELWIDSEKMIVRSEEPGQVRTARLTKYASTKFAWQFGKETYTFDTKTFKYVFNFLFDEDEEKCVIK